LTLSKQILTIPGSFPSGALPRGFPGAGGTAWLDEWFRQFDGLAVWTPPPPLIKRREGAHTTSRCSFQACYYPSVCCHVRRDLGLFPRPWKERSAGAVINWRRGGGFVYFRKEATRPRPPPRHTSHSSRTESTSKRGETLHTKACKSTTTASHKLSTATKPTSHHPWW